MAKKQNIYLKHKLRTDPWPRTVDPRAKDKVADIVREAMVAKPTRTIKKDDNDINGERDIRRTAYRASSGGYSKSSGGTVSPKPAAL